MTDPYLGQRTIMRAFLDSILPDGPIHHPAPGGDLDHFLSGLADNAQFVHDFLETLAHTRDPRTTPVLEELEREYGITPNVQLTDSQRRATLALVKYKRNQPSTLPNLQNALDRAGLGAGGYGLTVYANDPAVDPGPFVSSTYQMYLGGGNNQYLGYNTGGITRSFLGVAAGGGLWIVNGDVFTATPNLESLGGSQSYLGYTRLGSPGGFYLGEYYSISYLPAVIPSPADSWSWPLVFFIAGGATRAYPNLIDRGDCESATPPAIKGQTGLVNNGVIVQDGTQYVSPLNSFNLYSNTAFAFWYAFGGSNLASMGGLIAGHTYTALLKIKVNTNVSSLNNVFLYFQDSIDGLTWGNSQYGTKPTAFTTWQQIEIALTVRSNAVATAIMLFVNEGGSSQNVWIDDITLTDVTLGPPISALTFGMIPNNMRQTLVEIVMRWKPAHTWCALMCNFS